MKDDEKKDIAYPRSIRRLSALLIVMPHFVKVVFVQLSHEASEVAVLKVLRKDGFGEALILAGVSKACDYRLERKSDLEDHEAITFVTPSDYLRICRVLEHPFRVSESFLQANPESLTYRVSEPGYDERHPYVKLYLELTKSLELLALATPKPMPPSMLSS